jgi:hypothetical protein
MKNRQIIFLQVLYWRMAFLQESNLAAKISHQGTKPLRKIQRKLRAFAPLWQFSGVFCIEKLFMQQSLGE